MNPARRSWAALAARFRTQAPRPAAQAAPNPAAAGPAGTTPGRRPLGRLLGSSRAATAVPAADPTPTPEAAPTAVA